MFALLFLSLLFVNTGHALQCIDNCFTRGQFGEPFRIPDGQCTERASVSKCFVKMGFQYDRNTYSVSLDKSGYFSYDYIYISSGPYLSYEINYGCSQSTDCAAVYAQKRIDEMVARNYDASRVYGELAPLIENPSRNDSIQCYDLQNNVITCSPSQICSLEFDTRKKKMKSRGCKEDIGARVFLFDGELSPSIHVECHRNLCNADTTLAQIKTILAQNGLTDADGRCIAAGTKEMASSLSVILAFIFALIIYF